MGAGALGFSGLGFSIHDRYNENITQNAGLRSEKLKRIASNSFAVNQLFRRRSIRQRAPRPNTYKDKYGEITMLDFPQFTKDTYPGVHAMDLWSSLFGDVNDDSIFTQVKIGDEIRFSEFDLSSASSKKYLDQLVNNMV